MNLYPDFLPDAPRATNLVERLRFWSQQRGAQAAFHFIDDQEELTQVSYAQLDQQARMVAAKLLSMGCRGERALLFYPPGLDFVAAFLGCLYAGTTAVPAFPPRRNRNMARVDAISSDAMAAIVLSVQDVIDRSAKVLDDDARHLKEIPWLATDRLSPELADSWSPPELTDQTLAVLQYTSGSTGQPKGVMLTHANLMHNCSIITQGFEADQTSVGLSWLPTYHDMGLVGGILNPLFIGRPNIFMAPMSFLQKPVRWLRNVSRFNVTISGGPNFAYALCNEKISDADCEGLDLSSWQVAFNGAEPIRADTLSRFVEKFQPYGFRPEAFYPCYGMAESTLIVSGAERQKSPTIKPFDSAALESNRVVPLDQEDRLGRRLVSSGRVLSDQTVLIVDPETRRPVPAGEVGEIWIQSDSVARGYWNNDGETERAFEARLSNDEDEYGPFLRSGDLGFLHDEQLYVTGRSKDLIIINGRNLYPHDFESIVESAHEAIRVGGGVAFSIEGDHAEQLVIAQELVREYRKYDLDEILAAIRTSVGQALDVAPHSIVLLKVGKLPKTSSGKVQRRACRQQFLSGQLDLLAQSSPESISRKTDSQTSSSEPSNGVTESRPRDAIESWLVNRIAQQLKIPPSKIDIDETFAFFGLDSITLIGISGELEDWWGGSVSPKLLFNYPTIAELSGHLATTKPGELDSSSIEESVASSQPDALANAGQHESSTLTHESSASEILANLNNLSHAQTALLLKQLLEEKAQTEVVNRRLSYGQQALWFLYQLDPSSSAYNIMYASRVRADLDQDALCRAFQAIVNRHEILRTSYGTVDGSPIQQVHPFQRFVLDTSDARDWSQDELDAEIQSLSNLPFDLQQGPVLRVTLFQRRGDHHVLLFVVHHIALDFWSFDLLFDELELFYRQEVTGDDPGVPEIKATYHDFVRWQQEILAAEEGDQLWNYWQKQLGGELPVLDLPTDDSRPRQQSFRGASFPFEISGDVTNKLIEISKSEGVTLFATFLATFQLLLSRYSGQNEIIVGCPTAGRTRSEFENVLGYFVSPVALRTRLSADLSWSDFLVQVRETLVGGITHQDYPLPLLVERLQVSRDPSRSPIFQVAIGWDTPRRLDLSRTTGNPSNEKPVALGHLGLEPFELGQQGSAFDLMLMLLNDGDSVSGVLQYNSDLFARSTVARMVDHFQTLLKGIAADPNRKLADFPIMNNTEEAQLLSDWNQTESDYDETCCLHELFESQSAQTPDSIAVEFDGQPLTYDDLNSRSNKVAHHLAALGAGPNVSVGIYIDRSLEMLIGLMGILKSGAAFVPLAPGTPHQRLTDMLAQCQAPIVLTKKHLAKDLPDFSGQVICLDSDWGEIDCSDNRNPKCRSISSDLAYVIFTSGSTGKPKGVQIEHRAVVNFLTAMRNQPGIQRNDVLLAVTTFTFDISVLELFLPLIVGAKVVVVGSGIAADGVQLAERIEATGTTIMQATPSTWRLLVEAGWTGNGELKILCGGEAMPPDLADSLIGSCHELWNMYGPTETTIWSAIDHVTVSSNPMPVGRPIANTQIYIVDDLLQPVPVGVKGNLYIGGEGLARGYLGQPELTAEKFIVDPFRPAEGARLYKTGDLARYRADGKIEFLGRSDFQVKVRGFRIELGEIESQLVAHPEIRQAVVTASGRGCQIDHKQLVAYFTFVERVPNTSELRDFMKLNLPDYMVPSIYVPLAELPLNSAGKVDRKSLPEPDSNRPELRPPYAPPQNETEGMFAEIWARVLGLNQVGIHDNFFALGGASMQSLEVTSRASECGIVILPAMLFQHPTIAELAAAVVATQVEPDNLVEAEIDGRTPNRIVEETVPPAQLTVPSNEPPTESNSLHANIVIESIGVYLPSKSVTTREVVRGCKHKIWFPLEDMTGIHERRVAADDEFTSDIACQAVEACLSNSKYTTDQIDLVICCHIGRDEQPNSAALEPGTAMYLKQRFQFPNAVVFDINNACAGMFTGINIAESYINSGAAQRVMVVSAEHISPVMATAQLEISGFIDPRIACLTLGDAGAAIVLEAAANQEVGFRELEMYSLSKYSSMCIGQPTEYPHGGPILTVPDPIKHTSIAIKNSIAHSKHVLDRSDWEADDIQWVIMHQTSERSLLDGARAINKTFKRKICTKQNTINNLSKRGNTASTSHFVAIWDNILNGKFQSGDNVVLGITGSGQTIGTGLYTFDDLPDRIRSTKEIDREKQTSQSVSQNRCLNSNGAQNRIRAASIGIFESGTGNPIETLPMVTEAVERCLQNSRYSRSEIDLVLFSGVYRTKFISEPALATIIANELEINHEVSPAEAQQTLAFDVINGSAGFLTAVDIASQMMRSGKIKTALVIASEVENNRAEYPGDLIGLQETASAMILDQGVEPQVGFGEMVFNYLPTSLDARTVTGKYTEGAPHIFLNEDPNLVDLYLSIIPETIDQLLEREGLSITDIHWVLPSQFSSEFIERLSCVLKIPQTQIIDLTRDGKDWFTSSLPQSMRELEARQLAKPGERGLVINIGAGLQVGCAIYHF